MMNSGPGDSANKEAGIPIEKNPRIIKRRTQNLFGFLQVEATSYHDSIEELEKMRNRIIDGIPEIETADSETRLTESTKDTLRRISELDPDKISNKEDLPPAIRNSPLVTLDALQSSYGLDEIVRKIQMQLGEDQHIINESAPEVLISDRKSREHLSYFAMTSAVVEQRSAALIRETLIAEDFHENEDVAGYIQEQIPQSQREELLYKCGIVGGEMLSRMQQVRGKRNRLVHRPHERRYTNPGEFTDIVESAFQVAKEVDDKLMTVLQRRYSGK